MAEKKYVKNLQKEKGKFGHYMTGTGGGEPIPAGKKMTSEKRDPDQPRDQSGRFTYNSVNGKPLKDISKSHGHSRGTTIPPTLTGGVGGIHYYSDSTHKHIVEGGQDALEKYTELTFENAYRKGDKLIGFDGKVAIASKDFIESATEYVANKKGEAKLTGALAEAAEARKSGDKEALKTAIDKILESGHYEGETTSSWERKEAESPEEKAALTKATAEGTKGHELVERKREEEVKRSPSMSSFAGWAKSHIAPSTPRTESEKTVSAEPTGATASLSDEQIEKFAKKFKEENPDSDVEISRSMLEEVIADPEFEEIKSADDILKMIGEEKPASEPAEAEEAIEESLEEDTGTEEDLIEGIQKGLADSISKEDMAEAMKTTFRKSVEGFAKSWAKESGLEDKSDDEIIDDYIKHIFEGIEKNSVMKDFRGE